MKTILIVGFVLMLFLPKIEPLKETKEYVKEEQGLAAFTAFYSQKAYLLNLHNFSKCAKKSYKKANKENTFQSMQVLRLINVIRK